MITCPGCGTHYATFQPACENYRESLPFPAKRFPQPTAEGISVPPPAPRDVPCNYAWPILLTDGWVVAGGVVYPYVYHSI
jgi:hypothetical protein